MSPKTLDSRHAIESCTFQLHSWRPFQLKTLNSESYISSRPYSTTTASPNRVHNKRPCLSDRATSFPIDVLDMSKLSLFDDDRTLSTHKSESIRWFARKRRRRGSRSVSGRSSDRSGTLLRCCSAGASAAQATCSDFHLAVGTDSSGELFVHGDANWASDVSDAARNLRRERDGGCGERENLGTGLGQIANFDNQGNESGYGSEPGYRGDAEFGYGDEFDEEEDDQRPLFWGDELGEPDSNIEMVGENTLAKAHHRCRRKKNDLRVVGPLR